MRSISDSLIEDLTWTQTGILGRDFELRTPADVVATLNWSWRSEAVGVTAERTWRFECYGLVRKETSVSSDEPYERLIFRRRWLRAGGSLDLDGSERLSFDRLSWFTGDWAWRAADGAKLVHFPRSARLLSHQSHIALDANARGRSDLPLLLVLGWYLVIQDSRDSLDSA